ncbi:MAG TPA: hypothetical protein PKN85_06810, partial [Syntrophorhabdaceae bacterium]|nr:hypothetical protein [Syntrophorhabdaceae bacterium]
MVERKKGLVIAAVVIVALALVPLFTGREYVFSILCMLFLYVTLSQSWNILGGYTGQINVGQAAFFGMGALVARLLWVAGAP